MVRTEIASLRSSFTFGSPQRYLVVAAILEALAIFGYLQFTPAGYVDISDSPRYLQGAYVLGSIAILLTFYFSIKMAKASYSPLLHQSSTPYLIAVGYLCLGIASVSAAYVAYSAFLSVFTLPKYTETGFGLAVGVIFGFLLILFIVRYGFDDPPNREELEAEISSVDYHHSQIENSNKAPIMLTTQFENLSHSLKTCSELLLESRTSAGRQLALDIRDWANTFDSKPEVSQALIVDSSRSPKQKELTELEQQFTSITERLERISNNE